MHDLSLDFLAHESLCRAFVVLASRPRARLWVTHSLFYLSINHILVVMLYHYLTSTTLIRRWEGVWGSDRVL